MHWKENMIAWKRFVCWWMQLFFFIYKMIASTLSKTRYTDDRAIVYSSVSRFKNCDVREGGLIYSYYKYWWSQTDASTELTYLTLWSVFVPLFFYKCLARMPRVSPCWGCLQQTTRQYKSIAALEQLLIPAKDKENCSFHLTDEEMLEYDKLIRFSTNILQ